MKTSMTTFFTGALTAVLVIGAAPAAHAGVFSAMKGWLSGEVLALLASAVLAALGGTLGVLFGRVARTFREAGEFLSVLGEAIEDSRLTREELVSVIREGKEIFAVWR